VGAVCECMCVCVSVCMCVCVYVSCLSLCGVSDGWQAIVHGVAKESDVTKQLNNDNKQTEYTEIKAHVF